MEIHYSSTQTHRLTHTLLQSISLSGPLTPSQAPLSSCDRLTAENRRASHGAPVPSVMWHNCERPAFLDVCVCLCVWALVFVLKLQWRADLKMFICQPQTMQISVTELTFWLNPSLWRFKKIKKNIIYVCIFLTYIVIFTHIPKVMVFGNDEIQCEQSSDIPCGASLIWVDWTMVHLSENIVYLFVPIWRRQLNCCDFNTFPGKKPPETVCRQQVAVWAFGLFWTIKVDFN